jgi:prolyl oligopeptidase
MPKLMEAPPYFQAEPVSEILHGISVTDPYRWLEDQDSPRTREWLSAQIRYARSYFDAIPGRDRVRSRVRELLDIETYDSIQRVGIRYFFRKRLPGLEQPCTFVRDGIDGKDQLLIDPAERGTGKYTAVTPLRVSPDGGLVLYEVKEGGERTGTFEILEVHSRKRLSDVLPRGYLRGFAFGSDSRSFYYVHEPADARAATAPACFQHVLGTSFDEDRQIFLADGSEHIRLHIIPGRNHIGFLVFRFLDRTYTEFHLWPLGSEGILQPIIQNAEYKFGPVLLNDGRILAITDGESANLRIVEVRPQTGSEPAFIDLIAGRDVPIQNWIVAGEQIFVSYLRGVRTQVEIFDLRGHQIGELPTGDSETLRLIGAADAGDEVFFERESFTKPLCTFSYSTADTQVKLWAERKVPFQSDDFCHSQVLFAAKDGVSIPMFLVGRRDLVEHGPNPTIMTSYGGYGVAMTPQFSCFVAFLMERGLPLRAAEHSRRVRIRDRVAQRSQATKSTSRIRRLLVGGRVADQHWAQ